MVGNVYTVRHGKPNLSRDMRISAREYGDWWAQYDESGLHPDETPPPSLKTIAQGATHVLCSTMPRAIETAAAIVGPDRLVPRDALYVEAPLPAPPVPLIRLQPGTWGVVSRTFWFLGFAPGDTENHPATWRRVGKIADRLQVLATDGDVVLCAHGYLNWMIDYHVRKKCGWTRDAREGGNDYWSWRAYSVPPVERPRADTVEVARVAE